MVVMMDNVIRIGIVGAPHSGKSSLTRYLRKYFIDEYNVVIAEDVSDRLFKEGLDPGNNISELNFQIECLKAYASQYKEVDRYVKKYISDMDKKTLIIYDTLPAMGQCFLNSSEDLHEWVEQSTKENFGEYKVDIVFVMDMLQGEYRLDDHVVERDFDLEDLLTIADRIEYVFEGGIMLPSDLTIDERAGAIIEAVYDFLN